MNHPSSPTLTTDDAAEEMSVTQTISARAAARGERSTNVLFALMNDQKAVALGIPALRLAYIRAIAEGDGTEYFPRRTLGTALIERLDFLPTESLQVLNELNNTRRAIDEMAALQRPHAAAQPTLPPAAEPTLPPVSKPKENITVLASVPLPELPPYKKPASHMRHAVAAKPKSLVSRAPATRLKAPLETKPAPAADLPGPTIVKPWMEAVADKKDLYTDIASFERHYPCATSAVRKGMQHTLFAKFRESGMDEAWATRCLGAVVAPLHRQLGITLPAPMSGDSASTDMEYSFRKQLSVARTSHDAETDISADAKPARRGR